MSNDFNFSKEELEDFNNWLNDFEVDAKLLVQTILAGQTKSGLVPVSHINKVAQEFGIEIEN